MISRVRNSTTTMMVLMLGLLAQVPHAQSVFYDAGTDKTWFGYGYSWLFAVALEVAVFFFVVHRRQMLSYVFAFASVCVNLSYYAIIPPHIAKWLVSVMLPLAIAFYSHLVVDDAHSTQPGIGVLEYAHMRWTALKAMIMRIAVHTHSEDEPDRIDANSTTAEPGDDTHIGDSHIDIQSDERIDVPDDGAQLDDVDVRILDAVRTLMDDPQRTSTPYAISKEIGMSAGSLRRKKDDAYIGRLPQLVAAGHLRNGGSEYTIAE